MEASADVSMDSGHAAEVCNCPQSGCIRVFQRVSISETHLSLENRVLTNFTKMCYKPHLRVRVALLLKATSESGESGFLTVCALVPGAQSSGPSSSLAGDPIVFKVTLSIQESKWYRRIVGELRGSDSRPVQGSRNTPSSFMLQKSG